MNRSLRFSLPRPGAVPLLLAAASLAVWAALASGLADAGRLSLPSDAALLAAEPWRLASYMFAHDSVAHMLVNIAVLLLFAAHFRGGLIAAVYLAGGLAGAATYVCVYSGSGTMLGASAAVMAVVASAAVLYPAGKVAGIPLLRAAAALLGISLAGAFTGNTGGALAHVGGALAGAAVALMCLPAGVRGKAEASETGNASAEGSEIERLSRKARMSGFDALTATEKRRFFEYSDNTQKNSEK